VGGVNDASAITLEMNVIEADKQWRTKMGFWARLFGKQPSDEGAGSWVVLGGPQKRPDLPPELKPFVEELCALHKRYGKFYTVAVGEARSIGKRINSKHGYDGMVTVCDTLRFVISPNAARDLEGVWDGIGRWKS
jgi:hypothetical protein